MSELLLDDKDPKDALPLPTLTEEQKAFIVQNWKTDIRELTRQVFKNTTLDGRSVECKSVRKFLTSIGKVVPPLTDSSGVPISLTDEQKNFIKNTYKTSSPIEMARILFGTLVKTDSQECKAVYAFCKGLEPNYRRDDESVDGPYIVPQSLDEVVLKVNKFAINPRRDGKLIYDPKNLSSQEINQLTALFSYLRVPLYVVEANKYMRKMDRDLFESTFISVAWDKPDLLAEEVHQYIAWAAETVRYTQIDRDAQKLNERQNIMLEDPNVPIRQAEVEMLNSMREKLNASMKQSAALLKTLVGDRSKRLNEKIQSNASLHNLVKAWKMKEDRDRIIKMSEKKQKAGLQKEVERLSDMDSLKAEIFGINKENILR